MPMITTWIEELAAHLPALRELEQLKDIKQKLEDEIADLTKRRDAIAQAYRAQAINEAREALLERETDLTAQLKATQEDADAKLEATYAELRSANARVITARDEAAAQEGRIAEAKRVQAILRKQLTGGED